MLEALARGVDNAQPRISIYELYDEVREILRRREIDDESRPELHLPNQADGDVSRLHVFPNAAYLRAEEQRRRTERAREDADARARAAAAARAQRDADERAAAMARAQRDADERAAAMVRAQWEADERAAAVARAQLAATMAGSQMATVEGTATAGPRLSVPERAALPAPRPPPEVNRRRPIAEWVWTIGLILPVVLVLLGVGVSLWRESRSFRRSSSDEAMAMMQRYKTDLCACRDHDLDCGKHAHGRISESDGTVGCKARR